MTGEHDPRKAQYDADRRAEQRQEQQRVAQQQQRDEVAKAARDAVEHGIRKR